MQHTSVSMAGSAYQTFQPTATSMERPGESVQGRDPSKPRKRGIVSRLVKKDPASEEADRHREQAERSRTVEEFDENAVHVPLFLLGEMTAYFDALEYRQYIPARPLGNLFSALQGLESAITTLEKISDTPLPVAFSAHLRHTITIYLLALPPQMVSRYGFATVPIVAIASFLFLGFVAAGDELQGAQAQSSAEVRQLIGRGRSLWLRSRRHRSRLRLSRPPARREADAERGRGDEADGRLGLEQATLRCGRTRQSIKRA